MQLNIFPNPASDKVNIHIVPVTSGDLSILIYDLRCELVLNSDMGKIESGEFYQFEIDINNLPSGMYIINLKMGESLVNSKLFISK